MLCAGHIKLSEERRRSGVGTRCLGNANKESHSPDNSKDLNFADRVQSFDWSLPIVDPRGHASAACQVGVYCKHAWFS